MANDRRFGDDRDLPDFAPPRRSGCSNCMVGCLIVVAIMLTLGCIAGFWLWRNWRGLASSAVAQGIKQGIDASDLPLEEKQDINRQIDRVADAFRDGRLSNEQAGFILQNLVRSPIMTSIIVSAAEKKYVEPSGLSEEEKADARTTLQRFLRGVVDEKISSESMEGALEHVADRQSNGGWNFRDKVSDEELRAFLEEAKQQADAAEIPEDPGEFDPSDEFQKIIDQEMGET